jgi:hypothetical protein
MLMGERLGIGHDPTQHAAYVKSWIQILRDDPGSFSEPRRRSGWWSSEGARVGSRAAPEG